MVDALSYGAYTGKTGDLGREYDLQYSRYQQLSNLYGAVDFKSMLFLNGVNGDAVLQKIENHIEGNESIGNGVETDLLSWDRYLSSSTDKNDMVFQSKDRKLFTNVNFNHDYYEVMDANTFIENIGLGDIAYDTYEINQNKISFYEFLFEGLADGQDIIPLGSNAACKWGTSDYSIREVDTSYWTKAEDKTNEESAKAYDSMDIIKRTMPQWMTEEIKSKLSTYKEGSTEYWSKFYELAVELMDQVK